MSLLRFTENVGTFGIDTVTAPPTAGLGTIYFGLRGNDSFTTSAAVSSSEFTDPIFVGGLGDDTYTIVPNSEALISEGGSSANDKIVATGISTFSSSFVMATIDNRHLVVGDNSGESFVLLDYANPANTIESFVFANGTFNLGQLLSGRSLVNVTWEQLQSVSGGIVYSTADINETLNFYAARDAALENHTPVVTAPNGSVRPNQIVAASTLFSATDGDGDAITQYRFWDSGAGGGYFTVGGTQQAAQQNIPVAAANLSTVNYVGGAIGGAETEWVQAYDGIGWGAWQSWTMSTVNSAPVVTAPNGSVVANASVLASTLFTVTDSDNDAITQYRFWDGGAGGGHFTVGGTPQAAQQNITVSAAALSTVNYVGGATPGSETEWLQAYDGFEWGPWRSWTMTTLRSTDIVSVVNVTGSIAVQPNTWLQASVASLPFTVSDGDGDPVVTYRFTNMGTGATSMHLWFGSSGNLAQGATVDVPAGQLSSFWLQGGSVNGTDTLRVQVFDGYDWSVAQDITVATRAPNHAPVVTAPDASVHPFQIVVASTLFSVTDADGDAITQYRFWDGGVGGGFFTVGGAQQPAQQTITVPAANLSTVNYVGGSTAGSETEWVQAFDGFDWGPWRSWTMPTLRSTNIVPVVNVTGSIAVQPNVWVQGSLASLPFTVTDGDADPVVTYRFTDVGTGSTSMHFWIGGTGNLAQGATVDVAANQLSSFWLQGGSANGTDTLRVQVFDGYDWSAAQDINVVTRAPNRAPVVIAPNSSVALGASVAASSLFTATDADNDAITQYRFWDGGAGGGYFTVGGVQQAAQQNITVSAANLSTVNYVGGAAESSETEWVQVFDGTDWSAWQSWNMASFTPIRLPEHVGTRGSDTFSLAINDVFFGLQGNDTLSGWGGLYLGGQGNDSYQVFANDDTLILEDGNSPDDLLNLGAVGFGFGSVGSIAAVIDGRHLYLAYQTPAPGAPPGAGVVILDWQAPANRIENFRLSNGTPYSYDQLVTALASFPVLNFTWEQLGSSTQQMNEMIAYYEQRNQYLQSPPTIAVANPGSVLTGTHLYLSQFITAGTTSGDAIQLYEFRDTSFGAPTGYFSGVSGDTTVNPILSATAGQPVYFVAGIADGTETFSVRAYDGASWTAWTDFTITTVNQRPADNGTFSAPRDILIGTNSSTYSGWLGELDGADYFRFDLARTQTLTIDLTGRTNFQLQRDSNGSPGLTVFTGHAGHTTTSLAAGTYYLVPFTTTPSGSGYVDQAFYDLTLNSTWGNHRPVIAATNSTIALGQSVAASSLFSVSDPDNDAVTLYRFNDTSVGGGSFSFGGMAQPEQTPFTVSAANLSQVVFNSAPSTVMGDSISIEAFDGQDWSAVKAITMSTVPVDGAGNSFAAARDLGTLTASPTSASDWVSGIYDLFDYYKFTAPTAGNLNYAINSPDPSVIGVAIFNASQGLMLSSAYGGGPGLDSRNLALSGAGDYYIRLTGNGNSNYNLSISLT